MSMTTGTKISRGTAWRGLTARLVIVGSLGALLAWALAPTGASGQQYPLPTTPPTQPTTPPPPPPSVAGSSGLPLLTPFPIIRIVGRSTSRGAKITVFTVRAAIGSYVVSRCLGNKHPCPYKQRISRVPGAVGKIRTVHVGGFERSFRAGVVLRVYVVDVARTGKFTSFKIRRAAAPRRNDGCVADVVLRPVPCPSG